MNISIIIPNYNGAEILKKNLPFVVKATEYYKKSHNAICEIVIVDDASTDNSNEVLDDLQKELSNRIDIKVIKSSKNSGFSSTVNIGVKNAATDIVILLNTDVNPEMEFIAPLITHFINKNIFAVGCMDKSIEDGNTVLRGRGIGKWHRGFLQHAAGNLDKKNSLWASGGSSAFSKEKWVMLGGMNELFNPFYWEDIDLSYRALKCGYEIVFERKSIVVHEHEKGAIKKKYSKDQVKKIAYRNQFIFTWINLTDTNLVITHLFWLPFHIIKAVVNQDTLMVIGFINAVKRLSKIWAYRSRMKKHFIKSDSSIQLYE